MAILRLDGTQYEIEAFGFDADGVLRDTGFLSFKLTCKVITELGGTPPASFDEFVRRVTSDYDGFFRSCGIAGGEKEFMTAYRQYHDTHDEEAPFEDVIELLHHMHEIGLKTFVVSGAPEGRLVQWLERHDLHDRFHHVAGDSRDKTACITRACKRLGVDPSRTGFIGDWGLDVEEARRAGCVPIGITRGHDSEDALRHRGAAHVIEHLSELIEALPLAA